MTGDRHRETELRQILNALHVEYRIKAEPIAKELAAIEARKPQPPIVFPQEWLERMAERHRCEHGVILYGTHCVVCDRKRAADLALPTATAITRTTFGADGQPKVERIDPADFFQAPEEE